MRFQVFLLSVAAILSIAVGAAKWRARVTAATTFMAQERKGEWVFAIPQDSGVRLWSRAGGSRAVLKHYQGALVNEGFDITPDLRRIASVDNSRYGAPQ